MGLWAVLLLGVLLYARVRDTGAAALLQSAGPMQEQQHPRPKPGESRRAQAPASLVRGKGQVTEPFGTPEGA